MRKTLERSLWCPHTYRPTHIYIHEHTYTQKKGFVIPRSRKRNSLYPGACSTGSLVPNRRQRLREAGERRLSRLLLWLPQEQWAGRQAEQFRDGYCEPWGPCVLP